MSVALTLSSLTPEIRSKIANELNLVSKNNFYIKGKPWLNQNTKPPLQLYVKFPANDSIRLPYYYCNKNILGYKANFSRSYPPANFSFNAQLRDYQIPIIQEATNHLNEYGCTTLNIYTGSGKTVLMAKLMTDSKLLGIVVYGSTVLGNQWKSTFDDMTDAQTWVVGDEQPPDKVGVIICMYTRIQQIPSYLLESIGFLAIDEAHTFCTPDHYSKLLLLQPKYVVAATATLERADKLHDAIKYMCGEHKIYRRSSKPFHVYKYLTGINVPIKNNKMGQTDWTALQRDILMHPDRNEIIFSLINKNPQEKILILTRLVDHVKYLYDTLVKYGYSVDYMAGNKKKYNDSRILIGTVSKIGTGFDEKAACADFGGERIGLLLLVCSIKDVACLEQVAGRVFRADFPKIIHFVDEVGIIKDKHWPIANRWYKSRNGLIYEHVYKPPIKIKLNNNSNPAGTDTSTNTS